MKQGVYEREPWAIEAYKLLIDRRMSVKQLAIEIGLSRHHVSCVMSGSKRSDPTKEKICSFLKIAA